MFGLGKKAAVVAPPPTRYEAAVSLLEEMAARAWDTVPATMEEIKSCVEDPIGSGAFLAVLVALAVAMAVVAARRLRVASGGDAASTAAPSLRQFLLHMGKVQYHEALVKAGVTGPEEVRDASIEVLAPAMGSRMAARVLRKQAEERCGREIAPLLATHAISVVDSYVADTTRELAPKQVDDEASASITEESEGASEDPSAEEPSGEYVVKLNDESSVATDDAIQRPSELETPTSSPPSTPQRTAKRMSLKKRLSTGFGRSRSGTSLASGSSTASGGSMRSFLTTSKSTRVK